MENQLITFSIQTLSISNFDNESQKQISLIMNYNSFSVTSEFPFTFQVAPAPDSEPITLEFLYKFNKFAKTQINFPLSFPSSINFTIFPLTPLELSPEKQRPSELDTISKSIGTGIIVAEYLEEKPDPVHIQSSICHDIALNIQKLVRYQENFSLKDVENFRVLIIGLNSKLKTLVLLQQRLESSEHFSQNCLKKREQMQASVQNTCKSLTQHNDTLDNKFSSLNGQIKSLQISNNELQEQLRSKSIEINSLQGDIQIKDSELTNLKAQLKNFEALEAFIRNLQAEKKALEEERNKLKEEFFKTILSFEEENKAKGMELIQREEEIERLVDVVKGKDIDLGVAVGVNNEKQSRILELESEVEENKRVIVGYKDLEKKSEKMEMLAKAHQTECVQLQGVITSNLHNYESTILLLDQEKNNLHIKVESTFKDLSKVSTDLQEKLNLYRAEQVITQDLRTKSTIIQQKLCNTVDSSKLFNQIKYLSTSMTELREKIIEDNDELTRQILQFASDYLNAMTVIQQVRDVIEDRDNEINILRDLIAELQSKTIYYPIKDDPVDEAIADYLNSRSEPLPIVFIREDYGLYLFGTKRVFIKLENNKITSNL